MKLRVAMLVAMLSPLWLWAGGFTITEENDFFQKKDDNYTQGFELSVWDTSTNECGEAHKDVWGLRSRMYTPDDISNPKNQPGDRPWAGVTTVFHEWTTQDGDDATMAGWELGTLGPESGVEWQQKTIHKWIGSWTPMGWSNQVPNEVSAQFYQTFYRSVVSMGTPGKWMADLELPYGYCGGTTFDYIHGGLGVRAGWNVPPMHYCGAIEPKAVLPKPFAYLMADAAGRYVLHNATFGHSFFRSHDDSEWDRDLIPVVGEMHYGACVGYKYFAVTYLNEYRTEEFEGQPEPFECGMIRLEFGMMF
jgi:hypothetical protein